MRRFLLLAFLSLASACSRGDPNGPVPVKFDRDVCKGCGMAISDRRFVAEIRGGPRGELVKFDDIGCAMKWLERQPFAGDPTVKIWVAGGADGALVDARHAHFSGGAKSPMGFGYAAQTSPPGLDFEAMRAALRSTDAGATARKETP